MAYILLDHFSSHDRRDIGASEVASERVEVPRGKSALAVARKVSHRSAYGRVVIVYRSGRTRMYDRFAS